MYPEIGITTQIDAGRTTGFISFSLTVVSDFLSAFAASGFADSLALVAGDKRYT